MGETDRIVAELRAGADALEEMARWCEQPDEPTGRPGWVSATDLRMRAAALRTKADFPQVTRIEPAD